MKKYWLHFFNLFYKYVLSKIIFLFNSEVAHNVMVNMGELFGKIFFVKQLIALLFSTKSNVLSQNIKGISFENPIGLAAGFDYQGKFTQILPSIGFGFGTVGTITNMPYVGNPKPRLARLFKSKSLMVYKGFKNYGIEVISKKLKKMKFDIPIGLSIGKTNFRKDTMTQKDAIKDIMSAFKVAEKYELKNSYYELNISCPALFGKVTFYTPKNLQELLENVDKLNIQKPIFIKMPISKSDEQISDMINVIIKFKISGVILGNTQTNRNDKGFVKEELKKFPVGGFSGKPTFVRSNELIKLVFQKYGKKLIIIGCGGVFSGRDAYEKIKLGASLVQLITGLIFEGPQLAGQINSDLITLIKKDGFKNISQAIGTSV